MFIAIRVTSPRDQTVLNQKSTNSSDQKVAQITSTTSQLNELINSYLETYQTKEMTYKFYISNQQAVLEASYKLLEPKFHFIFILNLWHSQMVQLVYLSKIFPLEV